MIVRLSQARRSPGLPLHFSGWPCARSACSVVICAISDATKSPRVNMHICICKVVEKNKGMQRNTTIFFFFDSNVDNNINNNNNNDDNNSEDERKSPCDTSQAALSLCAAYQPCCDSSRQHRRDAANWKEMERKVYPVFQDFKKKDSNQRGKKMHGLRRGRKEEILADRRQIKHKTPTKHAKQTPKYSSRQKRLTFACCMKKT